MSRYFRGFDFQELSLDERVMLAYELLASVRVEIEALPLSPDRRAAIAERLIEVGGTALAA